MIGSSLSQTLS